MFKPRDIIELIADNVRKTRNPFGVPNVLMNRWWKGIDLRTEGDELLFTGLMYQSVPYIEMTTRHLERYEDSAVADYVKYGKYMPKFLVGLGLALLNPTICCIALPKFSPGPRLISAINPNSIITVAFYFMTWVISTVS